MRQNLELAQAAHDCTILTTLPFVLYGDHDAGLTAKYCASAEEAQFLVVWNCLAGRSTMHPEDLHCVFANLLDFDVSEILKLGSSSLSNQSHDTELERMKAMVFPYHAYQWSCSASPIIRI